MIEKIFQSIENQKITVTQWMTGFIGVFLVRYVFESISSPTTSGIIPTDIYTIVHVGLFFLATALGLICVIGYFNKNYLTASKFVLFGLPVIWLAPILDIILSHGTGYKMTYIFDSHGKLLSDFFSFWSFHFMNGATYGIRIEIFFILCGVGLYVWKSGRKILPTVLAVFFSYLLIFIMATIPGLFYTIANIHGAGNDSVDYIANVLLRTNILHNTIHDGPVSISLIRFIELGFDKLLSQILFIFTFIFGIWTFIGIDKNKFRAVIKNCRPERVAFYLVLLFFGMFFAYFSGKGKITSGVDILGIVCLVISWISLWMYAISVNDIVDVEIDKISNSNRPLITEKLSASEMQESGYIWLVLALLGSWSAGFYPFFMCIAYVATSYIYSMPPLRLKRVPILSSFLIGVACLVTVLSGFFFISSDKKIEAFPVLLAIGIVTIFTLATNIRDMKDIEGDRREGISTLPVIFGENGPKVVGVLLALSFLLAPIFLSIYSLYIFALPASILGYKFVTRKPFVEKYIFLLGLTFLLLSSALIIFL